MSKKILILAVLIIVGVVIFLLLRRDQDFSPTVFQIDSISPAFGPTGTAITIRGLGFSKENNDIGIQFAAADNSGFNTGYINQVVSEDGQTIEFNLPEAVGVCSFFAQSKDQPCIELALILPKKKVEIFIVNKNGQSNSVPFIING